VFLHDPEVPPTNNHAELMLRPAVITRKVGGCNKTLLGSSLMVTLTVCRRTPCYSTLESELIRELARS